MGKMAYPYPALYIRRMADPIMHDAEAKKAMDSRLARIEGQVRAVRRMIGEDEPCEDIAQQLAAARKALDRAFYEMVSCMIRQDPPAGSNGRTERAGRVAELLARFG
jgi:CsoR family transcriptional regulator, copper-sensing transcriptional repressor